MNTRAYRLPGRKGPLVSDAVFEAVLIDAMETPIERPKGQRNSCSGKKKRPTLKSQIVVDQGSGQILCVHVTPHGRCHDLTLLRRSRVRAKARTRVLLDSEPV